MSRDISTFSTRAQQIIREYEERFEREMRMRETDMQRAQRLGIPQEIAADYVVVSTFVAGFTDKTQPELHKDVYHLSTNSTYFSE